jgi:hypothetical protein
MPTAMSGRRRCRCRPLSLRLPGSNLPYVEAGPGGIRLIMRTQPHLRRRLVGAGVAAAAALVLAACGGGHSSASARHVKVDAPAAGASGTSATSKLSGTVSEGVGVCPGATHPPGAPYELTIVGTIRGSLTFTHDDYGSRHPAVIPHIKARFCGTLDITTETGTVQPTNISFAPANVYFDYHFNKKGKPVFALKDGLKFQPVGVATAQVSKTSAAANGGLEVTLSSQVDTWVYPQTGDNAVRCLDGPVSLALSTQSQGGSPFVGRLQHASMNVAQQGFTVPAAALGQSTCQSGSIDDAAIINALLDLPATDTSTTETFAAQVNN